MLEPSDSLKAVSSHLDKVLLEGVCIADGAVVIRARTTTVRLRCPSCGVVSSRVHGRYRRRLSDVTLAQRAVVIDLQVRRFLCATVACVRRTFAEQVAGLTQRFARRTLPLRKVLEAIGLALAGRAGTRLARVLAIPASVNTLLRLQRLKGWRSACHGGSGSRFMPVLAKKPARMSVCC